MVQILVACFGNVLRRDDGFGVVVAERLLAEPLPQGVRVLDVGIGGIHMVHDLLTHADGLVVVDALDLGRPPGTVLVVDPEVLDVERLTPQRRRDELADMHYATPDRALMLAGALGVLPERRVVVGCQPAETEVLGEGLSPLVQAAVETAVAEVRRVIAEMSPA
jgi:hydrogenase maturation protease